jgi:hypothetical protein
MLRFIAEGGSKGGLMNSVGENTYYVDSYGYAETDYPTGADSSAENAPIIDGEEDLYTEIYSDADYYEAEASARPVESQEAKNQDLMGILDEAADQPPSRKTLEIASNFQQDPEEIEALASEAGLDLDHLPNPPDDRVMRFLNSLGIPDSPKLDQFQILKDQRAQNMRALKASLEAQNQLPDQDGKKPFNQNDLDMTEAYRVLRDPEYGQMMEAVGEMRGPILEGLKKMGYQAAEGETPDQLTVNGATLDFFDEDTAGLGFSTEPSTLTQNENEFFTIPEEVDTDPPEWVDTGARVIGGVVGGTAGAIIGGVTMIPGASIVGAVAGAYIGEELGHSLAQGIHDFFN